ncbi:amidohydrolase [Thalassobius sp. I31.1]|uniref:amidohydrolase n=1 Tax=Thalassobius sp. I31.1 TaxID=2109912 RepID=UPI000D1AA499|nr:amidohydrolase [Thalassobius sp. I31.1]
MSALSQTQLTYLTELRHDLHRQPEISGEEVHTAARIVRELKKLGADRIWDGLGGAGVAAEFRGAEAGPTVLFRCELDGLPITEVSDLPYKSEVAGKGHLCGHDGHMCMVLGLGMALAQRPARGRVILLFQPAEETGFGAQAVIDDPRWPEIRPDYAFAYHNVPGHALGEIGLRNGPANCASRGMQINFEGKSSHAAAPEDGISPAPAIAQLIGALPELSSGTISDADFGLSTLTHVNIGEAAFGISPGTGELRVTLRSMTDDRMAFLTEGAEKLLDAARGPLQTDVTWHDVFHAVTNSNKATATARTAAETAGAITREMDHPMRWSEDFGRFGQDGAEACLLFLGAGETQPQLHNPDYDFPDSLLTIGPAVFLEITRQILGKAAG